MKRALQTNLSLSGEYYHGGHMCPASGGHVSMRSDGIYYLHYYNNGGNVKEQIDEQRYIDTVKRMSEADGKAHPTYGCVMKLYFSTEMVDVYEWDKA